MTTFSNRSMCFPYQQKSPFYGPLCYTWYPPGTHSNAVHEGYTWLERGDPIAEINTLLKLSYNPFKRVTQTRILLKSPVNGLYMGGNVYADRYSSILLPEGEEIPANAGEIIYSEYCRYCDENRKYLFQTRRPGAAGDLTSAQIDEELHRLLSISAADFEIEKINPDHLPFILKAQPAIYDQIAALVNGVETLPEEQPAPVQEVIAPEPVAAEKPRYTLRNGEMVLVDKQAPIQAAERPPEQAATGEAVAYRDVRSQSVYDAETDALRKLWSLPKGYTTDDVKNTAKIRLEDAANDAEYDEIVEQATQLIKFARIAA